MSLIDNLSAVSQRLIATVPASLGIRQYKPVILTHEGATYSFTAKITELTPGQRIQYLTSGIQVNLETRLIDGIPLIIPEDAVHYGKYAYDGVIAEVVSVDTNRTVKYTATVQEFRNR